MTNTNTNTKTNVLQTGTQQTGTRRCGRKGAPRRGVAAVELAAVLFVFLTMVLGMLDLGIGVFRYHVLAAAARHGARQAIVHGSMADELGPWGPGKFNGNGADTHPLAESIRTVLTGFQPADVKIVAEWPDGGNEFTNEDRVRVSVSADYRPIMTFIFGNPKVTLEGTSTMPIAH